MKAPDLIKAVSTILEAHLVPMITGSPGIGKSDIIRSVAKTYNLFVIDMRLSQCDPTDMLGFPTHDGARMTYAPPIHFPLVGDSLPVKTWKNMVGEDGNPIVAEGRPMRSPDQTYDGWLLFLDEFSSAPKAVQAAAYKLVLDRQVGEHHLHERCMMVCAGNKASDNAIVNPMSTAMQSRMIHLEMEADVKAWIEWGAANKIDHRVLSFVQQRPELLHKFDPNHDDKTFACPRTWAFASKLIMHMPEVDTVAMQPILAGTISAGIAAEFLAHLRFYSELPSMDEILAKPLDVPIKDEPALYYAIGFMVAAYMDEKNAEPLMRFLGRFPLEFATVAVRAAIKRDRAILKLEPVREWTHTVAAEVF